jgi:hypothetical protein
MINLSGLTNKNPKAAYLEYLKMKKQQRDCEINLHIYGSTFEMQGRREVNLSPHPALRARPESHLDF